nr:uncharacterized protein LOC115257882 [Aedes albopictus]
MASPDNGGVKDSKNAPQKKKMTRQTAKDPTVLLKELDEERKRNASLMIKLKKARANNKLLEQSMEDGSFVRMHSTMRDDSSQNGQHSMIMSSMSNLSFASLQVPECKPIEGEEEIDRKSYEQWKQTLEASMQLAGVTDETTKINIFRIKAGHKLLDVLESTVSNAESPDIVVNPYSNAVHRLSTFYGSRDYMFMQRQKLRSLAQKPGESDVKYVKRVISAAKLCDFGDANVAEQVADTIQCHALNRQVRDAGRKILRKRVTLVDLLEKVRAIEMENLNEEIFAKSHGPAQAKIAAVAYGEQRGSQSVNHRFGPSSYQQNQQPRFFGNGTGGRRGRGSSRREFIRSATSRTECWRCLSRQHQPSSCHAIEKVCRNCQKKGHIERACHQKPLLKQIKRRNSDVEEDPTHVKKIAVVKKDEDDGSDETVSVPTPA